MDERLYERLDALIDVLNRIERRLGEMTAPPPVSAPARVSKDPSLRGIVRMWAEQQALAISAQEVDALLDNCAWDSERLAKELARLSKQNAAHPVRSFRRLARKM